jgi:hypothetical protein
MSGTKHKEVRCGSALTPARHPYVMILSTRRRIIMGFGRGVLLWLLGVPIPIILLLALFWHH